MVYAAAFCEASDEAAMRDMCAVLTHHASQHRPVHYNLGWAFFIACQPVQGIRRLQNPERRAAGGIVRVYPGR